MTSTVVFALMLLISCGSSQSEENENPTAYEMMETAFEDFPSESKIKPMMEDVMKTYNMQVTEENLQKVASMLIGLRKESKVGVTEMEILKHIYQNGSTTNSLPDQAAVSFLYLESTK
jgi:Skp family chaperone for outer membrane proteins